jgi:hypothetical protein
VSQACPGVDAGPDGACLGCGRPTAVYAGLAQHKRGRWRERGLVAARSTLRAAGRRKARILRAIDLEGPTCECGVAIAVHPPLPKPLPWGHGRPCSRTSLDRGHGWDGREMPAHSAAEVARWQTSHHRSPNAFGGALGR